MEALRAREDPGERDRSLELASPGMGGRREKLNQMGAFSPQVGSDMHLNRWP